MVCSIKPAEQNSKQNDISSLSVHKNCPNWYCCLKEKQTFAISAFVGRGLSEAQVNEQSYSPVMLFETYMPHMYN